VGDVQVPPRPRRRQGLLHRNPQGGHPLVRRHCAAPGRRRWSCSLRSFWGNPTQQDSLRSIERASFAYARHHRGESDGHQSRWAPKILRATPLASAPAPESHQNSPQRILTTMHKKQTSANVAIFETSSQGQPHGFHVFVRY
jgi:hypothetical protein